MENEVAANPYKAPADLAGALAHDDARKFYREGEFLVVRDGAELPNRCIHTNEEVPVSGWRKKKQIAWTPQWVILMILFSPLVLLLLALLVQKKAKIIYSMSPTARKRLVRKRLVWLGIFALGVVVAVIGGNLSSSDASLLAIFGGILMGIIGIIGSLVQHPLAVKGHRDGRFTLKGFCPAYLSSLPD
jgi:hypothetical protein